MSRKPSVTQIAQAVLWALTVDTLHQSKHHRWKIDAFQLRRYGLTHRLTPKSNWWEDIEVTNRELIVHAFRDGATMCALVCEDLARYDPVIPALTAIGPNLLVALLMDGSQLMHRWSARHATALSDDPGTSVLTFTSLGLIERANSDPVVGLWKEPGGLPTELKLDMGCHALALDIDMTKVKQVTLDGRDDGTQTLTMHLQSHRSVRARGRKFTTI